MSQLEFFPSRTMSIYMARMFFVRIIVVLALLVVVLQTLDLLGESGDILAVQGNGEAQLWHYASLRIPQLVEQFLPFSVLLATIITLATLNQNSEVIAMKAAGLSAHQVLAPLLITSLFLAGLSFVFNEKIVVNSTSELLSWQAAEYGPIEEDSRVKSNIWVRDGADIIYASKAIGTGEATELSGVSVYRRDEGGTLNHIISADIAGYTGDGWKLAGAEEFDILSGKKRPLGMVILGSDITPDQFTLSNVDADSMTFFELRDAIENLQMVGRKTASLEADMWHKISLSSFLMPLLGAVAAFGLARSGQLFLRAVIGMALGFAYFVADNFALSMGNLGIYQPFFAAWVPFALFFLLGEMVLLRTEE